MAQERVNRVEIYPTADAITEASKRFLARRVFWKTAEVTYDAMRYATLPVCLVGNIIKNTFKTVDGTIHDGPNAMSQGAGIGCLLIYEMLITPPAVKLIQDGIRRLSIGETTVGIGLTVLGGIVEIPNALILGAGIEQGVVDTYRHTIEKNQALRERRVARRESWK